MSLGDVPLATGTDGVVPVPTITFHPCLPSSCSPSKELEFPGSLGILLTAQIGLGGREKGELRNQSQQTEDKVGKEGEKTGELRQTESKQNTNKK